MSTVPLSAIDYLYIHDRTDPTTFVFRYPSKLDVPRITDAFYETAREFVGASGVLVASDDACFLDVSRAAAEIQEVSLEGDKALRDCVSFVRTDFGQPLTRALITHLDGGRGTALSFSMSHVVGDGYSTFLFLTAWAAKVRGDAPIKPLCDRTILTNPSARVPGHEVRGDYFAEAGFFIVEKDEPLRRLRWHFEDRSLASLCSKVQGLSPNDVLCATLWKESLAKHEDPEATFSCVIDLRRFRPDLGPLFFGNAVLMAPTTHPTEEVRRASLAQVGEWIRDAIAAAPKRIDAAIAELESARASHGLTFFRRVRSMHKCAYAVTNLSRLPYTVLDFGSGSPVEFEAANLPPPVPGCGVMPGRDSAHVRLMMGVP
jgi:hypothetical protein